jgi:hypothetical protein
MIHTPSVRPKCRATKLSTNANSINCSLEIAKMNKGSLRRPLLKDLSYHKTCKTITSKLLCVGTKKTQLLNKHVDILWGASQSTKKKQQYQDLHIFYSNNSINGTKNHIIKTCSIIDNISWSRWQIQSRKLTWHWKRESCEN